ncbi:MAG TPA: riboflavin synthase [Tepidisphaeraceae bacterium]|nr:riboflavin synthase [Tepidisphaeraceae bacterium]
MFTGIIETLLSVQTVADSPAGRSLTLAAPWSDVTNGESIAINGCCLTVASQSQGKLTFDVIPETLSKTNLAQLKQGDQVHAERALRIGDRLSGHFVQGHIDGPATLIDRRTDSSEHRLRLRVSADLARYIQPKGSICLDGVSLTVASLNGIEFDVALIPATLQLTLLAGRPIGWNFNLETDILAKTIIYWLECRC